MTLSSRNVAEALLLRLKQLGVDWFIANPGTEFASIIRGFADLPACDVPTPVLAPHEFLAVSIAYGQYLVTQRPQAVMTHANVGAANALIGLMGAARMNVPLIYIAGMTSSSERARLGRRDKLIHWSQDSKDLLGLCREYVKWEVRLDDPSAVCDALDRAYAIAMSPPCGPVAIGITRDVLMSDAMAPLPCNVQVRPTSTLAPNADELGQIGRWLNDAKRPLAITNRLGQDVDAVAKLCAASERHGMGVITPDDFYCSFPPAHAHHLGFSYHGIVREADFVLVLDTDAPWYPMDQGPNAAVRVAHVGADPLFEDLPLRSHRGDAFLRCSPRSFLDALCRADPNLAALADRRAWVQSVNAARTLPETHTALTADTVAAALNEVLDDQTVLFNELGLRAEYLPRRRPGGYFRSGATSSLGWSIGCALGYTMAARDKLALAVIGDGVFYLSPLLGALAVATEQNVALAIIVLNNGGMASIEATVRDFYPLTPANLALTRLPQSAIHLEKCADFVSGLALRASTRDEFPSALQQAVSFARERRRPVIVNALLSTPSA